MLVGKEPFLVSVAWFCCLFVVIVVLSDFRILVDVVLFVSVVSDSCVWFYGL